MGVASQLIDRILTTTRNLPRFLRTLRHLRLMQVWGRLWMHVYRPRVDARAAPPMRSITKRWRGCARSPSLLGPATLRLLNVEHAIQNASDWNHADWPQLWLYNLHYFDDLAADGDAARLPWQRELVTRWIVENPPARGVGWEPYPTSLRIVNWIKWALAGSALGTRALHSLATQTRWLCRNLEFHLLGNHLWANAKALVFAGVFFCGDEVDRWRRHGLALIRRELAEQILPDGGHFERSPLYHAIVLEDVLDLVQLTALQPALFDCVEVERWRGVAARMLRWLRVMTHPDGGIALFNDAALGIAPDQAELAAYAARLGIASDSEPLKTLEALTDSGYVRMQVGVAVLIADVGEIGPDYLPGHAHADTLSFELSLYGVRMLVNGGTSTYAPGAERARERGTPAHNTVTVDGQDSSEVWAAFRVGRRARPRAVEFGEDANGPWLRAAHDGYAHLRGRPWHKREWSLSTHGLYVTDRIEGRCARAEARFRLAPDWRVDATAPDAGTLTPRAGTHVVQWQARSGTKITDASYHPGFGRSEACSLIEVPLSADGARFTLRWH